jgi:hypothetical protein
VAAKYLRLVHNLEIDPDSIVVDTDLNSDYDLRDTLGLPLQMAIIPNHNLELPDLSLLNAILENPYYLNYFKEVLRNRWDQLALIGFEPTYKSYLYLDHEIENLVALNVDNGYRVNLLCNDYEFEALIRRLKLSRELLNGGY